MHILQILTFFIFFINQSSYGMVHAGFGEVHVDIPHGTSLAGYGHLKRRSIFPRGREHSHFFKPSLGQIDPLRVKTTYLRDHQGNEIFFVNADIIAVTKEATEELLERLEQALHRPIKNLFFTATHTHSGPGGISNNPFWQVFALDSFSPEVHANLLDASVKSVIEALNNTFPAQLRYGKSEVHNLTFDRRHKVPIATSDAFYLIVTDAHENIRGGMINYASHGTYYRENNLYLSSDFPGQIERQLEYKTYLQNSFGSPKPVFSFFSSAAGDVDPDFRLFPSLEEMGKRFSEMIQLDLNEMALIEDHVEFKINRQTVKVGPPKLHLSNCIPFKSAVFAKVINLGKYLPDSTELSLIHLGPVKIFPFPGEITTSSWQHFLRFTSEQNINVFSLTNDHLSYILTEEELAEGTYEGCANFYGVAGFESLKQAFLHLTNFEN